MPFDQPQNFESQRTRNLKAARALITPFDKWTYGIRKDENGRMCALGAMDEVLGVAKEYEQKRNVRLLQTTHHSPEVMLLAKHTRIARTTPVYPGAAASFVAHHNNELGHERTLEMFDGAIAESIEMDALALTA